MLINQMSNVLSTEEFHREDLLSLIGRLHYAIETFFKYRYGYSLEMGEGRTTEMAPHLTASSAH